MHGLPDRSRNYALASAITDGILTILLCAGIWYFSVEAGRSAGAPGLGLSSLLAPVSPLVLALGPLAAALVVGAIQITHGTTWLGRAIATPVGVGLGFLTFAAGALVHGGTAAAIERAGSTLEGLAWVTAAGAGAFVVSEFLAATALIANIRHSIAAARDQRHLRALRMYDGAAARLGDQLESTEKAFRHLLTRAENEERPLTALLRRAGDALSSSADREALPRHASAAAGLLAQVATAAAWIAATGLAVVAAWQSGHEAAWVQWSAGAATLTLCSAGVLLPRSATGRIRISRRTAMALVTLTLVFVTITAVAAPLQSWWGGTAMVAAAVLSFRLERAALASVRALALVSSAAAALVLAPLSWLSSRWSGTRVDGPSQ